MQEVIKNLNENLELLQSKLAAVTKREQAVTSREEAVAVSEKELGGKVSDFTTRESEVVRHENINAKLKEIDEKNHQISVERSNLENDKREFNTLREGETLRMAEEKKSIDKGWADLKKRQAAVEAEVVKGVEEIVKKFGSKTPAGNTADGGTGGNA